MKAAAGTRDPARGVKGSGGHGVAYLCERFPSFLQTFIHREVEEMIGQGMNPLLFSIRAAEERAPGDLPLRERVNYLPADEVLVERVKVLRAAGQVPGRVWEIIQGWRATDKMRLYQAHYVGTILRRLGVRHVHAHFAGIAARDAYWMQQFSGISYSFTAHANDVFCYGDHPVTLDELIGGARFVAAASGFSEAWLRAKFPQHAEKFELVYNGIQVPAEPAPMDAAGVPLILSVGRYVEKKGFGDLIEACALLRERGVQFRCQIVGGGPLEQSLRAQVAERGLAGSVEIIGPRSEGEVRALLAEARVFALACRTESDGGMDNLPTVIMEAMAAGRAVVSTRLAAVPEMVREGETGLLTAERDVPAFANALENTLRYAALAVRMGQAGRALAAQLFAVSVTAGKLKRLLVRRGRAALPMKAWAGDPALIGRSLAHRLGW